MWYLIGMGIAAMVYFIGFVIQQIYDSIDYRKNGVRWGDK